MKMMMKTRLAAAACASALLVAACGGGGSDEEPVAAQDPTEVPAGTAASVAAWFAFAKALASTESGDALSLGKLGALPVSDTDEPLPLGQ
jgi:ABC-type glycerol-3-phosphate transport system substrate-binding protein